MVSHEYGLVFRVAAINGGLLIQYKPVKYDHHQ